MRIAQGLTEYPTRPPSPAIRADGLIDLLQLSIRYQLLPNCSDGLVVNTHLAGDLAIGELRALQ
jgi:hypothetical protein